MKYVTKLENQSRNSFKFELFEPPMLVFSPPIIILNNLKYCGMGESLKVERIENLRVFNIYRDLNIRI